MIDQRISKSDKLAALKTDRARVLYFMIYPHTDCEGRFSGDPREIKEECCPRLKYSIKQIAECLIDMDRVGLLNLYEANDLAWVEFTRFDDFQLGLRKDREAPSKIPPYSGLTPEDARRTPALILILSLRKVKEGEEEKKKLRSISFDLKSGQFKDLTDEIKNRWKAAYPACDVDLCILQAAEWLVSNPKKIKGDYQRFLTNWLKREQDHGGTRKGTAVVKGVAPGTWLESQKKLKEKEAQK
jgi:hypothetical protein